MNEHQIYAVAKRARAWIGVAMLYWEVGHGHASTEFKLQSIEKQSVAGVPVAKISYLANEDVVSVQYHYEETLKAHHLVFCVLGTAPLCPIDGVATCSFTREAMPDEKIKKGTPIRGGSQSEITLSPGGTVTIKQISESHPEACKQKQRTVSLIAR